MRIEWNEGITIVVYSCSVTTGSKKVVDRLLQDRIKEFVPISVNLSAPVDVDFPKMLQYAIENIFRNW